MMTFCAFCNCAVWLDFLMFNGHKCDHSHTPKRQYFIDFLSNFYALYVTFYGFYLQMLVPSALVNCIWLSCMYWSHSWLLHIFPVISLFEKFLLAISASVTLFAIVDRYACFDLFLIVYNRNVVTRCMNCTSIGDNRNLWCTWHILKHLNMVSL